MDASPDARERITSSAKRVARLLLTTGGNRLELLAVEMQQERDRLIHAMLMALGVAALLFLSAFAMTAVIAMAMWPYAPTATLLVMACLYAIAGCVLLARLRIHMRRWMAFAGTIDQLRKDRLAAEELLS